MLKRLSFRVTVAPALCLSLLACAGPSIETIGYAVTEPVTGTRDPKVVRSTEGIAYALPLGLVVISAAWDGKQDSAPKITFGDTQILPDPTARFRARGVWNSLADDRLVMSVENGLLASVNATNKDQTGAAIGKVVEIAVEAAKAVTLVTRTGKDLTPPSAAYDRTIVFDPFKGGQDEIFAALGLVVDVRPFGEPSFEPTGSLSGAKVSETCDHSLCYRDPVAVSIRVTDFSGNVREIVTLVPDQRVTSGIDVARSTCVEANTALTFTKGMLTQVDLTRPSPVVGCLEIPLQVLQRIVQVPGELLKFETGNIDAERALIEAQNQLHHRA